MCDVQEKLAKVKQAAKGKDELEPAMQEAVVHIKKSNELTRLKNRRWQVWDPSRRARV